MAHFFAIFSFTLIKIFTPKLPIGLIQPSPNLIGPKSSQVNFKQVPVNQSESESKSESDSESEYKYESKSGSESESES